MGWILFTFASRVEKCSFIWNNAKRLNLLTFRPISFWVTYIMELLTSSRTACECHTETEAEAVSWAHFWNALPTGSTGGKEVWWVFSDVTEEKLWVSFQKEAFISLGEQRSTFVLSTVNDKMRSRLKTWFHYSAYAITECHLLFIQLCKLQGYWVGFSVCWGQTVTQHVVGTNDSYYFCLHFFFFFSRISEVKFQNIFRFLLHQSTLETWPTSNTMRENSIFELSEECISILPIHVHAQI